MTPGSGFSLAEGGEEVGQPARTCLSDVKQLVPSSWTSISWMCV